MNRLIVLGLTLGLLACGDLRTKEDHQLIEVFNVNPPVTIDGKAIENAWLKAQWYPLDQIWLGDAIDHTDFKGRYKLLWDERHLYILVEVIDDVFYDQRKDPLKRYWDDDCVEIFIDEDNSGGLHQYSHNAFAYHVALDGNVVDIAPDREARLYNDHVFTRINIDRTKSTWEMSIKLYPDSYIDDGSNSAIRLESDKKIGFAIAYCDNDGSKERENFIGSVFVPGEDKNQGWIDADIFGTLILKE
ncbi:MAG: sugar-binding protein [Flavobacteriaceae bacterium]